MRPTRIRVNVMPIGNCIISLDEILDFRGNQVINNIDALLDELFLAVRTVSIEGQERRYNSDEKNELVTEIYRLQEGGVR